MGEPSSIIAQSNRLPVMHASRRPSPAAPHSRASGFGIARAILATTILWTAQTLPAQELRLHPTPFSVTLDFQRPVSKPAYPIWLESVQKSAALSPRASTTQRIRLRRLGQLNAEIQLRIFFDDLPGRAPVVAGYTETGRQLYLAPALGAGLNLPSSESLSIPVLELDYIEITVPGDGSNLRGAFLCTLAKSQVRHALDFEAPGRLQDPFGNAAGQPVSENDAFLSGRVRATLADVPTPCSGQSPALFEFALETVPQMAVFRFEVLGVDPVDPPEFILNQQVPARPALQLPDLADPAYLSRRLTLETDPRFQYSGWLPGQLAVPGSALKAGVNRLWIRPPNGQLPLAIRSLTLDLKYPAPQLLNPAEP